MCKSDLLMSVEMQVHIHCINHSQEKTIVDCSLLYRCWLLTGQVHTVEIKEVTFLKQIKEKYI